MGYDFTGGRSFDFPIDFSMGLTTVQRYCAACDERGDRLAQNATKNETAENLDLEILENNIIVKKYIIDKWQNIWKCCPRGHFYRTIEPKVSFCIKYEDKNRKKKATITRLRLGKCCINEYLAMMEIVDSDKCSICNSAVKTVEHFLLQCPSSDLCRAVLIACKQMKITPTIGNVLADDKIIDVIFRKNTRMI